MTRLFIVDTLAAAKAARDEDAGALIATDNPLLAHDPALPFDIVNADALLNQDDALKLGRKALALAAALDEALAVPAVAERHGLLREYIYLTGVSSRLAASLLHRGAVLTRLLNHYDVDRISLRLLDQKRWESRQPLLLPRFGHPARNLAEYGFFGVRPVDFRGVAAPLPASVNDTAIKDYGRRVFLLPWQILAFEAACRLGANRMGGRQLLVAEENETLREALPWLMLRGFRIARMGALSRGHAELAAGFDQDAPADPLVRDLVFGTVDQAFRDTSDFDARQSQAVAEVMVRHITAALVLLGKQTKLIRERLEAWQAHKPTLILSNGLFGPAGAQAYGLARAKGLHIVEFEHGVTASIAALTQTKLDFGGPPRAAMHVVSSDKAAAAFGGAAGHKTAVVGLPDQIRRLLHAPAQRWLARRRLGLSRADSVVMHVSTLPMYANHRPGLGTPTETTTWDMDRRLLTEVYPGLRHKVVFKQYPTQRFPHEPGYAELFRLEPNISITKDEDFRYIRGAADVLVTSTPTSTFGWCIGTGAPIVWLDSGIIHPLTDDKLREVFAAAFLYVDMDQAGWENRLRQLLDRPLSSIKQEWADKAGARNMLYLSAISGPAGSVGRRAAAVVTAFAQGLPTRNADMGGIAA